MKQKVLLLLLCLSVLTTTVDAQTRTTTRRQTTTAKRSATAQKKKTTAKKKTTTKKKTTQPKVEETASIKGLKNESAKIKKNIKEQERRLRNNERDVKKRLQTLMVINSEIVDKKRTIDTIRHDITQLEGDITQLQNQLNELQKELEDRKDKYMRSLRYMHRNRSFQNQLMFVFSAKNFSEMLRRMRFMREYATYQRVQGEMVKTKRAQVKEKHDELTQAKQQKNVLLNRGIQEHKTLEGKQVEQQKVVSTLKKEQKTIQKIIADQRKKDAAINAKIDQLIAIEIEKARQRAIAEAKRRAEEEAARKRAEEQARRKSEGKSKNKESDRSSASSKTSSSSSNLYLLDSEDRRISGSFESNKGRLPIPVAGKYRIVSHYGQYNVEGLSNVTLDNKGINILGAQGAQVRSIFDGEVSAVFNIAGSWGVMVRHGSYISVYCNLGSVGVHRGQKVSTRQTIGTVGAENILQFQLRREKAKLNPEVWLGR